jgi:serine/threonine protein kinase
MEKMASSFATVIQELGTGKRNFGEVATRMLRIIQEIHQRNLLVIDTKPENFMLNSAGNICMIDFGMLQSFKDYNGHRENTGSDMVGTAMYASLHLHSGDRPARRDDVEALLYVLMETLLKVDGQELPWATGTSDNNIGILKQKAVSSPAFWKSLKEASNASVGAAIQKAWKYVHELEYNKKPDYDLLFDMLKGMDLGRTKSTARRSRKPASKKRPSPDKDNCRASKRQDTAQDNESYYSAEDEEFFDPMEYEVYEDDKKPAARYGDGKAIVLKVIGGPHEGETLELGSGKSLILGSALFPRDRDLGSNHCKLEAQITSRLVAVNLTKIGNVTVKVQDVEVKAKTQKCFINNRIKVGSTVLQVAPLSDTKENANMNGSTTDRMSRSFKLNMDYEAIEDGEEWEHVEEEVESKKPAAAARFGDGKAIVLKVIGGPHEGETLELESGKSLILGSALFPRDKDLGSNHCKLEAQITSRLVAVNLTKIGNATVKVQDVEVKAKTQKCFINNRIKVGSTVLQVAPLSDTKENANMNDNNTDRKSRSFPAASSAKSATRSSPATTTKPVKGVQLDFVEGPYKGQSLFLTEDNSKIVLGSNPKDSSSPVFALKKDSSIPKASCVAIEVQISRTITVLVTDLNVGSICKINQVTLAKGKSQKCFINEKIILGESVLKIRPMGK